MTNKQLVKNILKHYINLENESPAEYHYYCHTEYDSNITTFEELSNANKIVLKSKINVKYIPIIMKIFQSIYDNNYWIFESFEDFIDQDIEFDFTTLDKLKNYDLESWCQLFEDYSQDYNIEDERVYTSVPSVDNIYSKSKKHQKVYTLEDIINLL